MGRSKDGLDRLAERLADGEIDESTYVSSKARYDRDRSRDEGVDEPVHLERALRRREIKLRGEELTEAAREAFLEATESFLAFQEEQLVKVAEVLEADLEALEERREAGVEIREEVVAEIADDDGDGEEW